MAKRGYTTRRKIAGLARRPIRIPQPAVRPLHIRTRKPIKSKRISPDAWWFVLHRRGVRQPKVGEDPLEARAVSKGVFKGTLPERIVYKYLVNNLRLQAGIDFTAQSSLEGGRLELGGLVADFVFPILNFIIQVQGPTHSSFIRQRKDAEQRDMLYELGYREIYALNDELIYHESSFDEAMMRIFNVGAGAAMSGAYQNVGGGSSGGGGGGTNDDDKDGWEGGNLYGLMYESLLKVEANLIGLRG